MQRHWIKIKMTRLISQQRQTQLLLLYMHLLQSCRRPLYLIVILANNIPSRIIQLMTYIDKLNSRGISINVDQGPERAARFNATEENPFFLAVDAEVNVAG